MLMKSICCPNSRLTIELGSLKNAGMRPGIGGRRTCGVAGGENIVRDLRNVSGDIGDIGQCVANCVGKSEPAELFIVGIDRGRMVGSLRFKTAEIGDCAAERRQLADIGHVNRRQPQLRW